MTVEQIVPDEQTRALLRNDLRGMTRDQMAALVARLTERMDVDPALAPIDLLEDKKTGAVRVYINARGAAELAKRHDLSDEDLTITWRERLVIVQVAKVAPDGRVLRDVGASPFDPEQPATQARAVKQATTAAHRRATLRMVGIFINEPEDLGPSSDA